MKPRVNTAEIVERLWCGEKALCSDCEVGYFVSPQTSKTDKPTFYECTHCKCMLNIDLVRPTL